MEEENPQKPEAPTTALLLTESQAGLINAALAHYWAYVKCSADQDLQAVRPKIEELQRGIIDEVRFPTVPRIDVEAITKLSVMNKAKQSKAKEGSEEWRKANTKFNHAYIGLVYWHYIQVHLSQRDDAWHFGREDPEIVNLERQ